MVASAGETDWDLTASQFCRNWDTITVILLYKFPKETVHKTALFSRGLDYILAEFREVHCIA